MWNILNFSVKSTETSFNVKYFVLEFKVMENSLEKAYEHCRIESSFLLLFMLPTSRFLFKQQGEKGNEFWLKKIYRVICLVEIVRYIYVVQGILCARIQVGIIYEMVFSALFTLIRLDYQPRCVELKIHEFSHGSKNDLTISS